jgi:hypothetical protein
MGTLIYSLRGLMSTLTKQLVAGMFREPFSWTLSQELWTQFVLDLLANFSGQITLSSVKLEQVITGPKDTTLRERNLSTPYSMSSEKKLKAVIASRASRSPILSAVVPDQEWELF